MLLFVCIHSKLTYSHTCGTVLDMTNTVKTVKYKGGSITAFKCFGARGICVHYNKLHHGKRTL